VPAAPLQVGTVCFAKRPDGWQLAIMTKTEPKKKKAEVNPMNSPKRLCSRLSKNLCSPIDPISFSQVKFLLDMSDSKEDAKNLKKVDFDRIYRDVRKRFPALRFEVGTRVEAHLPDQAAASWHKGWITQASRLPSPPSPPTPTTNTNTTPPFLSLFNLVHPLTHSLSLRSCTTRSPLGRRGRWPPTKYSWTMGVASLLHRTPRNRCASAPYEQAWRKVASS
jgi:hypothetical protein